MMPDPAAPPTDRDYHRWQNDKLGRAAIAIGLVNVPRGVMIQALQERDWKENQLQPIPAPAPAPAPTHYSGTTMARIDTNNATGQPLINACRVIDEEGNQIASYYGRGRQIPGMPDQMLDWRANAALFVDAYNARMMGVAP